MREYTVGEGYTPWGGARYTGGTTPWGGARYRGRYPGKGRYPWSREA